jgi:hypothetical protein
MAGDALERNFRFARDPGNIGRMLEREIAIGQFFLQRRPTRR